MSSDAKTKDPHGTSTNTEDTPSTAAILLLGTSTLVAAATMTSGALAQAQKAAPAAQPAAPASAGSKPNILVIWGDDIGIANISAYSNGLMGYETPNIDRIAREGLKIHRIITASNLHRGPLVVHHRPARHAHRTDQGRLPRRADGHEPARSLVGGLLKNLGYATGQFGKNHLGDRNELLPTVNGFDEFFGNLYHLNAEEEPELPDYPKDPAYRAKFGPRGVLQCKASDRDDPTVDPRFGRVGKQTIEDTGPLTKKRMETIDDETSAAAIDFIKRQRRRGSRSSAG